MRRCPTCCTMLSAVVQQQCTTPPTTVKRDEQQLRQLREVGYSSHSVAWYAYMACGGMWGGGVAWVKSVVLVLNFLLFCSLCLSSASRATVTSSHPCLVVTII